MKPRKKPVIHSSWKAEKDGEVINWEYIGLRNCPSCRNRKVCKGCNFPFTLSTAEDEVNYCSQFCETGKKPR